MIANGWRTADSDMHVMEPPDLWQRYIDPAFLDAAPVGLDEIRRDMRVLVKDHVLSISSRERVRTPWSTGIGWRPHQDDAYSPAEKRGWDAQSQLEAMDAEGLDAAVLFPSRGLFVLGLDSVEEAGANGYEPELAAAVARAYNDWLHDFCAEDPSRMYGAAMLAPHDVSGSVDELARCVEDLGFKAAYLTPGLPDRRPWHDPVYDPIWAECVRLGVPICFHGGGKTYAQPDFAFGDILGPTTLWHPFNQPLGIMFVATCLAGGGVLERFPELKVGLLEGNCSWFPYMAYRWDEHWEWLGRYETPDVRRKPSEYLLEQCFLSVEADETPARMYIEEFGDDNLVCSTDYPHADSKFPHAMESFLELPLPESSKQKILWENYAKLYDFPKEGPGA